MEATHPPTVQMESVRREEPSADALYRKRAWKRDLECGIFGIKNQRRICDELARSELEAMERDVRYALFYQNLSFQIVVRQRRWIGSEA